VLFFTGGVALATAVLFGLAPALGVGRIAPAEALKERGRGITGESRFSLRNLLVVAQVALSLALVVAAGLFVHTFAALTTRYVGLTPDPLLLVGVDVQRTAVPIEGRAALFERLREAAATVPGVASVAVSVVTPVGNVTWNEGIEVAGGPTLTDDEKLSWENAVSPGWFSTYDTHFKSGRDFDGHDRAGAPAVAIINESFARRFYPGLNPLGQRFEQRIPTGNKSFEVIGVVEDAAYNSLRVDAGPTTYIPLAQLEEQDPEQFLTVRAAAGAPGQLAHPIAAALEAVDGGVALKLRPLVDQLGSSLKQERLVALLAGFFGVLALLLSGLGLYGVTAYTVGRRRAEIGIRLALGATRTGIVQLVLRRVGWLVGAGIVTGAALSLWLSKYVAMLLYGVTSHDPWTLLGAAAVLGAVGLLAGWLPAQRASRVDPTVALRTD
jgi:putative ABC transport system permease protein